MRLNLSYLEDFVSLFFPVLCPGCSRSLLKNEAVLCTDCIYHLPYTNFHLESNNRVSAQLRGRINYHSAASFLYFKKGSRVQNMMHQLKYNNRPDVGLKLGEMYGSLLKLSTGFNTADFVVPVPLHPLKLKKRGYNQSDYFARGLASSMENSLYLDCLKRVVPTDTQTKKSRFSRYENLKEVFAVDRSADLAGKHILLVDDVITTGATMEACALQLQTIKGVSVSIVSIAFTD